MTQEPEIVVNGESVGYGMAGMLVALERMIGTSTAGHAERHPETAGHADEAPGTKQGALE